MPVFKLGEVVYYAFQLNEFSWAFKRAVVVAEDNEKSSWLKICSDATNVSSIQKCDTYGSLLEAAEAATRNVMIEQGRKLDAIDKAYRSAKSQYSC